MKELFFLLLRNALWRDDEPLPRQPLPEAMVRRLLAGADQQAVGSLIAEALVRCGLVTQEDQRYECLGVVAQVQQHSSQIDKGVRHLAALMTAAGVDYVVVKGQAVATYYPDGSLREAGDIDYYVAPASFDRSVAVVRQQWGVEPRREGSDYHVHFQREGVTFEGHFALTQLYSRRRNRYWQQLMATDTGTTVNVDGRPVRTLSPTLHALYVFLHLYHHLMELGVGLRQLCDLAVLLHYGLLPADRERLRGHLRQLGMERAFKACAALMADRLGLPPEDLPCGELTATDRHYADRILAVMLYRGNMGRWNKRSGFSGWRHKVESTLIKLSHFAKFAPLAPAYSCRWMIRRAVKSMA